MVKPWPASGRTPWKGRAERSDQKNYSGKQQEGQSIAEKESKEKETGGFSPPWLGVVIVLSRGARSTIVICFGPSPPLALAQTKSETRVGDRIFQSGP